MSNAFLINPEAKTIEPYTIDLNDYTDIQRAIGDHSFDAVGMRLYAGADPVIATVWVDDEGALLDPEMQHCFLIGRPAEYRHLAGLALVTGGADTEGNTMAADPRLTVADLQKQVRFVSDPVVPEWRVYTWDAGNPAGSERG